MGLLITFSLEYCPEFITNFDLQWYECHLHCFQGKNCRRNSQAWVQKNHWTKACSTERNSQNNSEIGCAPWVLNPSIFITSVAFLTNLISFSSEQVNECNNQFLKKFYFRPLLYRAHARNWCPRWLLGRQSKDDVIK